jgi:hypothetical protein
VLRKREARSNDVLRVDVNFLRVGSRRLPGFEHRLAVHTAHPGGVKAARPEGSAARIGAPKMHDPRTSRRAVYQTPEIQAALVTVFPDNEVAH